MQTKGKIRQISRAARDAMTPQAIAEESVRICTHIMESEVFRQSKRCMLYYPLGSEASLLSLAEQCFAMGKRVAFPRVTGETMEFVEVTDMSQFSEGCFHVMEPTGTDVVTWEDALVMTPGVAFDRNGGRIGYGKGFYDRYFAAYPALVRMGAALRPQLTEDVRADAYDKKMHYVVTPDEVIRIREDI